MSLDFSTEQSIRYLAARVDVLRLYQEVDHAYAMAGSYPCDGERFIAQAELWTELAIEREKKSLDFWEERF